MVVVTLRFPDGNTIEGFPFLMAPRPGDYVWLQDGQWQVMNLHHYLVEGMLVPVIDVVEAAP